MLDKFNKAFAAATAARNQKYITLQVSSFKKIEIHNDHVYIISFSEDKHNNEYNVKRTKKRLTEKGRDKYSKILLSLSKNTAAQ